LLPLLVALFVLSGAAGLFYEAVWSRYLSLFVGHGAYAQVITLGVFLGGLGLGALAVSRRSARLKDPLLADGIVEAVIGVIGLVLHDALYQPATRFAYDTLFPAIGSGPLLLVTESHARRLSAPRPVLEAIAFGRALAEGDTGTASASARVLLAEARAGRIWLPADDLLDGAVPALTAEGHDEEAREGYETLISFSTRPATDFRLILLNAYVQRARESVGGTVHE
jgi:hypothetical protein